MVIVETKKEYDLFKKHFSESDTIVIPIECDFNKHPKDTKLCLLYVKTVEKDSEEFILPFRHSDATNLDENELKEISTSKSVFTYNKKKLLHFLDWEDVSDMNGTLDIETSNDHDHVEMIEIKYKDDNVDENDDEDSTML